MEKELLDCVRLQIEEISRIAALGNTRYPYNFNPKETGEMFSAIAEAINCLRNSGAPQEAAEMAEMIFKCFGKYFSEGEVGL